MFKTYDQCINQLILDKNFDIYNLLQDLNDIYHKVYESIKQSWQKNYQYYDKKTKLRNIFLNLVF